MGFSNTTAWRGVEPKTPKNHEKLTAPCGINTQSRLLSGAHTRLSRGMRTREGKRRPSRALFLPSSVLWLVLLLNVRADASEH